MLLITHPSNIEKIEQLSVVDDSLASSMHLFHKGYKLIECRFMPATRPSGMYSINGCGRYDKEQIRIKTPFIEYGPEDLEYLIYAGIVKELEEMNILCINERQFDFFSKPMEPVFGGGYQGYGNTNTTSIATMEMLKRTMDNYVPVMKGPLLFGL